MEGGLHVLKRVPQCVFIHDVGVSEKKKIRHEEKYDFPSVMGIFFRVSFAIGWRGKRRISLPSSGLALGLGGESFSAAGGIHHIYEGEQIHAGHFLLLH